MKTLRQMPSLVRASLSIPRRRAIHSFHSPRFVFPSTARLRPSFHSAPRIYIPVRQASTIPNTPTADALMENLTDLYSTARDEFEIAAEETEKKSTYGAEDREAAHEAFKVLKDAFAKARSTSDEDVGREVERRVGPRIRELESALKNMDELALED